MKLRAFGLAVLLLTTMVLSGSAQATISQKAPLQGTASYSSQKPIRPLVPITVTYSSLGADATFIYTAVDDGVFAREGLSVKPIYVASAPGIAALISGQAQFSLIGGGDMLAAIAGGSTNLKWIATQDNFAAYEFYSSHSITKPSQLNGATIAASSAAGTGTVCTKLAMSKLGISNYKISYLGSATNDTAAVLAGTAAGMCDNPPASIELAGAGDHLLLNLAGKNIRLAQAGIATTESEIQNDPNIVQRFLTALTEAGKIVHETSKKQLLATRNVLLKIMGGAITAGETGTTLQFYRHVQTGNMIPVLADFTLPQRYEALIVPSAATVNIKTVINATFAKTATKAVYGNSPPPA